MAAKAYKAIADVSIPRAIHQTDELVSGEKIYETEGRLYAKGEYVLAKDISPPVLERIENGELDHLLEEADEKEALAAFESGAAQSQYGAFAPEHEVERVALAEYGHEVVPREDVIEAMSDGADDAKSAIEDSKKDGRDERPAITEAATFEETPSLVERSNEEGVLTSGAGKRKTGSKSTARVKRGQGDAATASDSGREAESGAESEDK